jgi:Tol biopolymer transport system component
MNLKAVCGGILTSIVFVSLIKAQQDDSPALKGAYLGQEPPGNTPEIFAPGVISTDSAHEFGITFAPNGEEILFTRRIENVVGNRIYYMKYEDGIWKSPRLSPFSDGNTELEPNYTPDGNRIFYNSWRPLPESVKTGNEMNVWIVRKENGTWKISGVLGPPVSDLNPVYVTQTWDSTIYFTGNVNRGIYRAECESGEYNKWERLPDEINSRYWAGHPFIDPDERYLLFDSNIDSLGTKNLFISFRMEPGKWSPSINVNELLGFPNHAALPHVTLDGRFLFFRSRGDIYWVSASFLKDLKEKHVYPE